MNCLYAHHPAFVQKTSRTSRRYYQKSTFSETNGNKVEASCRLVLTAHPDQAPGYIRPLCSGIKALPEGR
ncbi:uncharacterized protein BO66DRAFT_390480 [Aspergillus aculeatinus CBS 121060]|uniref:Uncharacterized protein n=1 Tax=Aspergillus aculeatinus CBS 121060 TaxID=1448322 RepID=A0ACD1HDY5_9EURO|nr:hypothetical protein BO66DRAFT_390480 [Aspergillus aculeatinus CBS 121060]RAH71991.1 hypothetical protein BO66DRAFT_390480 [Aspergillus aculeatinus CBS 121060]